MRQTYGTRDLRGSRGHCAAGSRGAGGNASLPDAVLCQSGGFVPQRSSSAAEGGAGPSYRGTVPGLLTGADLLHLRRQRGKYLGRIQRRPAGRAGKPGGADHTHRASLRGQGVSGAAAPGNRLEGAAPGRFRPRSCPGPGERPAAAAPAGERSVRQQRGRHSTGHSLDSGSVSQRPGSHPHRCRPGGGADTGVFG